MSYTATIFNVLIASPGDVQEERRIAREVVHEWNSMHSRARKIVLMPRGWEKDAYSSMGRRAQGELNKQIVDDADLLIAIFGTRIGTPTGEAEGGSVEELARHMKTEKPAMVFQSFTPADPRLFASDQYKKLGEFIDTWAKPRGVLWGYQSTDEFRDELRRQLATRLNDDPYFVQIEPEIPSVPEAGYRPIIRGGNFDNVGEPTLSPEARTLLVEAADDKGGIILYAKLMTGPQLQTNGKQFVEVGNPRSSAIWEGALEELENDGLIKATGPKRQVFQVTREGYDMADRVKT
ncbi:hypothetical protein GA0061098_103420 [Bradyrhizobium shewense]|uniref:DUF4062 domain-containing protein n=1 Tax=Bradyrhizobium shewense TaxID=1761772 RepID=A0A1C3XSQ0_9BRAD|nr:hypothetical protein [Bradyrhizobium shewense]SCB55046.1 hypothetical protein GA0061098_103420 [Bradyrhizobium shewense]